MHRENKLLVMLLMIFSMLTLILMLPTSFAEPYTSTFSYEEYGPHLDNIHFVFTGTPENSFLGLEAGEYDIIDWALSETWFNTWGDPLREDVRIMGYGGEYGMYVLDVRQNNSKPIAPPFSTQSYVMTGDPTEITMDLSDLGEGAAPFDTTMGAAARHALAHMIDRTWIVSTVMGGLGEPIYTSAPKAQGAFVNPNVEKHPQDFAKASVILDRAGFTDNDGDGWRDIPGSNVEIILDFFIRLGIPREQAGGRLADDIEAQLNIHVNRQWGPGIDAFDHVMVPREMDLYTGGWIFVTFPDHYLDLYSSEGWWPAPSFAPNYMRVAGYRDFETDPDGIPGSGDETGTPAAPQPDGQIDFDPEVDRLAKLIVTGIEADEVKQAAWDVQELYMKKENVYTIPLVSTSAPKAWRTYKVGTAEVPGNEWKGIVNETGQGVNNFFTYLNAHTDNEPNSGTIIYALSYSRVDFLNPVYANWYQSWEILGKVYDSMLYLDPIGKQEMKPWMASKFIHAKEFDTVQGKAVSTLTFTLRKDVYWHDGVQLTADDVIFTLKYLPDKLEEKGNIPASWDSMVREINRIDKIDDFHIKVWLNLPTYFAPIWVGGNVILPEHIWKSIVDDVGLDGIPGTEDDPIQQFAPDPNLIGSGPFEMDASDYSEGVAADIYAYKPASAGYMNFEPIQNFVMEGEVAEAGPNTNTYWVGESYVDDVKIANRLYNLDSDEVVNVTATLYDRTSNVMVGQTWRLVNPLDWEGVKFDFPLTGSVIRDVVGALWFNLTDTWTPPPGITGEDVDKSRIVFKVTVDGDVISTNDDPGVNDVNTFDASKIVSLWGPTGPYIYPPADINWDSTVDIFEALIIMGNYGAAGA